MQQKIGNRLQELKAVEMYFLRQASRISRLVHIRNGVNKERAKLDK